MRERVCPGTLFHPPTGPPPPLPPGHHRRPRSPVTMSARPTLKLLFWCCCLLVQCSYSQDEVCECNLSHGRCDDNGECRCDPGWEGPQCEDCAPKPGCVHGSCHQPWQCICESGWAGRFCDKDIYVCASEQPCQNGATCVTNNLGEYSCICPEGFRGRDCELKVGPCEKKRSPCKNGGLCEDNNGYATELSCRCLAGFAGPRCEVDVDDCLMRPCANGATCLDGVNRFSCICPTGFTGRFCTVNMDDCSSRPCLNGGRCLDRVNTFLCLCPPGFGGKTCEMPFRKLDPGTHLPTWSSYGWSRNDGWVTPPRAHFTTAASGAQGITASSGGHLLKISVKEVVTQQGPALTEVQLITVLVLGGMTVAVMGLTAVIVLKGHLRDRSAQCGPRPAHLVPAEQEVNISFLHSPAPQMEKKQLNTDII